MRNRNIILIGLMGSGKTTVGQLLAKRLQFPFIDSDHELELRTGVSVATIFEIEGEPAFRQREAAIIDEISRREPVVLGTGGGAILEPSTRTILRERGTVIYLHSTAETSYERVRRSRDRPLLMVSDPLYRLRQLYALRHPMYSMTAHHTIESYRDRPTAVVNEITSLISPFTESDTNQQSTTPAP